MRTPATYADQTSRLLAMLRAVATSDHTPASLAAAVGVSAPTIYRMLNEVAAFGTRIEWDGAAYRVREWGVLSRSKII